MKFKSLRILFFVAFFILLSLDSRAFACSCGSMSSPCEAQGESSAAFVGLVENYEGTEKLGSYRIKVEQVFSGNVAEKVEGFYIESCGYSFIIGERYFIYAYSKRGEQVKRFRASYCSRIFRLEKAEEDLTFFQSQRPKMNGSRIYGTILEDRSRAYQSLTLKEQNALPKEQITPPLLGIQVKVEGQENSYNLTTDKNGQFEIDGLKPGEYLVQLLLPGNREAAGGNKRRVFLNERGCSQQFYSVPQ